MSTELKGQQEPHIRSLFTRIAGHYDSINRLLSLGQDLRWRGAMLHLAQLAPDSVLLDVATGTGDVAMLARQAGVRVVGVDLTPAMLTVARDKVAACDGPRPAWLLGDGLTLPFEDATFDAASSAFMMRNVPDVLQAFREQRRVVRPGGRVVCLELTWPRWFPMSWLFRVYFFGLTPLVGWLISSDREAYQYLPRSVKRFLTPAEMARTMRQAGLRDVSWQVKMAGTVALYVGVR